MITTIVPMERESKRNTARKAQAENRAAMSASSSASGLSQRKCYWKRGILENEHVRVLRVKYGAHEKSVMHSHPACFAIFLTESRARFTFPDGKSEERSFKAHDTMSMPAETHLPENLDDKPLEVVLVEFK